MLSADGWYAVYATEANEPGCGPEPWAYMEPLVAWDFDEGHLKGMEAGEYVDHVNESRPFRGYWKVGSHPELLARLLPDSCRTAMEKHLAEMGLVNSRG